MLCYNRSDVSKEIDAGKTSESKECGICHYRYFLNKGFNRGFTLENYGML